MGVLLYLQEVVVNDNKITYDYTNLLSENIGKKNGIEDKEIKNIDALINNAYKMTFEAPCEGMKAIVDNLEQVDIKAIIDLADRIKQNFEYFVLFGLGGSSLGGLTILKALCPNMYNAKAQEQGKIKFFIEDNIDPDKLEDLLNNIEVEKTMFCVVSKSGQTVETLSQFFLVKQKCENVVGENWSKHFVILTDDNQKFLNTLAKEQNMEVMYIPTNLGGRFSVLSVVGMLPASVLGLDIRQFVDGAKNMYKHAQYKDIKKNPVLCSAVYDYLNYLKGKNVAVLVAYTDKFKYFGEWYCQLWAESIGKKQYGREVEKSVGQTPVAVIGPVAQHSQFQLYLEGPDDKVFTFIKLKKFNNDLHLSPEMNQLFGDGFVDNKNFADLVNAECDASVYALTKYGKPNQSLIIDELDEYVLGQLFTFFMIKTVLFSYLVGVNPFGQPAVESIKVSIPKILKNDIIEKETKKTIVF